MNTLTADEWAELSETLDHAKAALDRACEILAPNYLDSPLGQQMDECIGVGSHNVTNAVWYANEEKKRLLKEAREVSP